MQPQPLYRVAYIWITRGKRISQVFYGSLDQWNAHAQRLGVYLIQGKRQLDKDETERLSTHGHREFVMTI